MRLENFIDGVPTLNENVIKNMLNKIKNKSIKSAVTTFKSAWLKIASSLKDKESEVLRIINSKFGTDYRTFDQISKQKPITESNEINEDFKHYWELLKMEGFPTLAFYPALTAWIEIGKILDPEMNVNWMKFGVYALFWLLLVSGKYLKQFHDWKKQNPDEYFSERPKLAKKVGVKIDNKKTRAGFV